MSDGFTVSEVAPLRSPVVILAFTGWSDTGTVSTDAAQRLIDAYSAERFIEVDPEEYFVFTDTRPHVKLTEEGLREVEWPTNEVYAARLPTGEHDMIIVKGVEPNLRWLTFANRLADLLAAHNPSLVCTIGARPAPTPHTRPIPVTGSSADASLARRFNLGPSRYQGPTGVVGVIHEVLRKRGLGLISLFANVPHYLNVSENPPGTLALLRALEPVTGLTAPVGELETEGERFIERVEEASRGDDQIGGYIRTLEEQYSESSGPTSAEDAGDLPSADDILRDIEDLLRGSGDS